MNNSRFKPLLSKKEFLTRVAKSWLLGSLLLIGSLGMGMIGYHHFETMSWVDAFVNASMILSGMGPVSTLNTDAGKLFAGCYALYSGLAFILSLGIVFAPVVRRYLHRFHLEEEHKD
jgi:hypothetical protein